MKRKKSKKNKLALGTNYVSNYIENPNKALMDNAWMKDKASSEVSKDKLTQFLDMFGTIAMQQGMNQLQQGQDMAKTAMMGMATGGIVKNVPVEVEGKEFAETPFGQLLDFVGPSHAKGGIKGNLPAGTEVYSKRISVDGVSMAKRKKKREKGRITLEKLLKNSKTDTLLTNAHKRTTEVNDILDEKDLKTQELIELLLNNKGKKLAGGTSPIGVQDGNPLFNFDPRLLSLFLPKITGTSDDYHTIDNGGTEYGQGLNGSIKKEKQTPLVNSDTVMKGQLEKIANTTTLPTVGTDNTINNIDIQTSRFKMPKGFNMTGGDMMGLLGTLYSSFAPMQNTMENRAGDTPNINAFKDFGKDALDRMEEARGYTAELKDSALEKSESNRNRSIAKNRNSARGINTMRALDLATDVNTNKAQGDIYDNFAQQMMQLLTKQAGFENQQDQAVMGGEQARDLADRQDRDNYYSQLAKDIATKGQGIQQTAKMLNQSKANKVSENALKSISKYGFTYDSNGNILDKNGTPASEQTLQEIADKEGITVEKLKEIIQNSKR